LPIAEILAPVIALAENGVVVTEFQAQSLANYRETFIKTNGPNSLFSQVYKAGDTIKSGTSSHFKTNCKKMVVMSFTKEKRLKISSFSKYQRR
jgi:gamma-glutamyltranspeptidase